MLTGWVPCTCGKALATRKQVQAATLEERASICSSRPALLQPCKLHSQSPYCNSSGEKQNSFCSCTTVFYIGAQGNKPKRQPSFTIQPTCSCLSLCRNCLSAHNACSCAYSQVSAKYAPVRLSVSRAMLRLTRSGRPPRLAHPHAWVSGLPLSWDPDAAALGTKAEWRAWARRGRPLPPPYQR